MSTGSTDAGLPPADEVVEAALRAAGGTDCVVIVEESSEAEVRFANNTTTTNGLRRYRRVTAISFWRGRRGRGGRGGPALGRRRCRPTWSGRPRPTPAGSPAAEDAAPLVGGSADGDFGEPPVSTDLSVLSGVLGDLGGAFGRAEQAERVLAGFAEHSVSTVYLGHARPDSGTVTPSRPAPCTWWPAAPTASARPGPGPAPRTSPT